MYNEIEKLTPELVQEVLKKKDSQNVSPDVLQYILELDYAAKVFKGNVTRAANLLKEHYSHLTFRTAQERIYDSIRFLNAGREGLPAKHWYNYYADRYEDMASLLAGSSKTAKYAKACTDAALECRLKIAESDLPSEFIKPRTQVISPTISNDRLSITEENLTGSWEEGLKMINGYDISETDRKRLEKEFGSELGMKVDDVEYEEEIEDGE